jgi:hypothetical protein
VCMSVTKVAYFSIGNRSEDTLKSSDMKNEEIWNASGKRENDAHGEGGESAVEALVKTVTGSTPLPEKNRTSPNHPKDFRKIHTARRRPRCLSEAIHHDICIWRFHNGLPRLNSQ